MLTRVVSVLVLIPCLVCSSCSHHGDVRDSGGNTIGMFLGPANGGSWSVQLYLGGPDMDADATIHPRTGVLTGGSTYAGAAQIGYEWVECQGPAYMVMNSGSACGGASGFPAAGTEWPARMSVLGPDMYGQREALEVHLASGPMRSLAIKSYKQIVRNPVSGVLYVECKTNPPANPYQAACGQKVTDSAISGPGSRPTGRVRLQYPAPLSMVQ